MLSEKDSVQNSQAQILFEQLLVNLFHKYFWRDIFESILVKIESVDMLAIAAVLPEIALWEIILKEILSIRIFEELLGNSSWL